MPDLDPDFAPMRAGVSGAAAALAYLGVMYADIAVTGSRSDDLLMLGRPVTTDPRRARLLGLAAHTSFGTLLGLLYGGLFWRRFPGPNWARGTLMLLVENALLWPLTSPVDRFHPSMRNGELPYLNRPVPFAQQVGRHIGFGFVLGCVYGNGKGW